VLADLLSMGPLQNLYAVGGWHQANPVPVSRIVTVDYSNSTDDEKYTAFLNCVGMVCEYQVGQSPFRNLKRSGANTSYIELDHMLPSAVYTENIAFAPIYYGEEGTFSVNIGYTWMVVPAGGYNNQSAPVIFLPYDMHRALLTTGGSYNSFTANQLVTAVVSPDQLNAAQQITDRNVDLSSQRGYYQLLKMLLLAGDANPSYRCSAMKILALDYKRIMEEKNIPQEYPSIT